MGFQLRNFSSSKFARYCCWFKLIALLGIALHVRQEKKKPVSDRQDWWVIFQGDDKQVCSPVLAPCRKWLTRCVCFTCSGYFVVFLEQVSLNYCMLWNESAGTAEGRSCAHPGLGTMAGGARAKCPHRGEGCLLYMPHLLILDKPDSYKSCVLHSSFMGQHFLHPRTYVHLQKTAIFPSEWCQLGFGEVCWTCTALFSLLGGEGGCWVSDTRIGLCWRPTCCPGTSPIEFCQLLWHRQSALGPWWWRAGGAGSACSVFSGGQQPW